jgi:hypothetical protein
VALRPSLSRGLPFRLLLLAGAFTSDARKSNGPPAVGPHATAAVSSFVRVGHPVAVETGRDPLRQVDDGLWLAAEVLCIDDELGCRMSPSCNRGTSSNSGPGATIKRTLGGR